MLEEPIGHFFINLSQIFLNLALKSFDGLDDFVGIFFHVGSEYEILGNSFVLVHLNVTRLKDMRPDGDFALDFRFVNGPERIPLTGTEVRELYIFGGESNMDIQGSFLSDFHEN